jgi:cytoskeletal protein CcmA (bactofilin family)
VPGDPADLPVTGWLGPGSSWTGDLVFAGRVRVDGALKGSIRSDDLLDLGAGGRIDGDVAVAQALVGGVLNGKLVATERVTVLETATVTGEIATPWLDVRPGARLDAVVRVSR